VVLDGPLTLGTAGHVDHGKTALVAALTGIDTDNLPEEKARGLTIELGFAPLVLPSGRSVSVVDVPGHERFVRTMVAGATGIDAFVLAVAADDGIMPQTIEHASVLKALAINRGVVAITKCDLADPAPTVAAAAELLPGCKIVVCSTRTGAGLDALRAALDRLVVDLASRATDPGAPRLHIDRVFTVRGRGTVVTGTLWSGSLGVGDQVAVVPQDLRVRVRGVEVHGQAMERAHAGQRVAANLTGVKPDEIQRGDALAAPDALPQRTILDCALDLPDVRSGTRVQVHHGTRDAPARLIHLADDLWQLRLEHPLLALDGDRLVVRRHAPADTLGGGRVLDASARRHGRGGEILDRLRARRDGTTPAPAASAPPTPAPRPAASPAPTATACELEQRLLDAGPQMLSEAQIGAGSADLQTLRAAGLAVRVSGRLYAHADVVAETEAAIVVLLERAGAAAVGEVRDTLGISRKAAAAFLEHLDATRRTRRLDDDRRVLAVTGRTGATQ
jgi:selenocysteine-specific elongation factor